VAGQLQGEVRLDADAHFDGAVGVVAPAAVGPLLAEDVRRRLPHDLRALLAEEGEQQDVLGLEDGVTLQLADPVAVGPLAVQQGVGRGLQSGGERERGGGQRG
jgi:hypothetical protein